MQIFGKNVKIEDIDHVEPKVDLMDLVSVLIENVVSKYYSYPEVRNIKETMTDGTIYIYSNGIAVRLNLKQNLNSDCSNKCYENQIRYFYDYSKDSFCSYITGKELIPNVGLLNI